MLVNWFIKRVKFCFCEILKTWFIASLISMYDAELVDDRNQVDVKIDPPRKAFLKTPDVPFCPIFHYAPTSYIYLQHFNITSPPLHRPFADNWHPRSWKASLFYISMILLLIMWRQKEPGQQRWSYGHPEIFLTQFNWFILILPAKF